MIRTLAQVVVQQGDTMMTEHHFLVDLNIGPCRQCAARASSGDQELEGWQFCSTDPLRHQLAVKIITLLHDSLKMINQNPKKEKVVQDSGLPEIPRLQPKHGNALPTLEPSESKTGTNPGQMPDQ